MNLIQIDVIGSKPAQAVIDGVVNMFARETALVRIVSHGMEDFGRDDDTVALRCEITQSAAEDLFAHSQRVHVGGIEEVDAKFQRALNERPALIFLQDP